MKILLLLALLAPLAQAAAPRVQLTLAPAADAACAQARHVAIKEEWKAELQARLPEFEQLWAAEGPRMMAATEAITGKAYPPEDITARLTLCDEPSNSFGGISVNMRFALKSFAPSPVPLRYKVDTLFHETLHKFLDQFALADSPLLRAHADEPARVRNHLHLLALQKAVLLKLNETAALNEVVAIDSQLPGGYYKRAWDIVNASPDTYQRYVAELTR